MKTYPYDYQVVGAMRIQRFKGRALLADPMGTGKTATALLYLENNPHLRPAVVICPASLKYNWEAEAYKHLGWRAVVCGGTRPPRMHGLPAPLYVVNYDVLGQKASAKSGPGWFQHLKALDPKAVIIDECQAISSLKAKRTRWVRLFAKGIPSVVALSGTPLTNRPFELFSVLNLIRPDLFPSFRSYADRYCNPRMKPWGMDYSGASHLDELHRKLTDVLMIRRRKEDVLGHLPPKTRTVTAVPITDQRQYKQAQDNYVRWLLENRPDKMHAASRAMRLTQINVLKQLCGTLKLPSVMEWIDTFLEESDEKLVAFAVHHAVLDALQERYKKSCVRVDGTMESRARQNSVDAFQNNPRIRVFLGNIQAAGKGLTLTAARTVVFAEMGWTPGEHAQSEDRCHRIGTTGNVQIHYLCAKGTIEERLARLIQDKQSVLSATLDGGVVAGDIDVFDLLCDELLTGVVG